MQAQVPTLTPEQNITSEQQAMEEGFDDGNDSFSEQAKHKYLIDSTTSDREQEDISNNNLNDSYQWSIPDVESGAYLHTLESKLYKLTNGRGLGKSLRMGTVTTVNNQKSKKKIEYSDGCKKCVDYFEEEIDLANVPKEELIGATPLLESELLHDNGGEESNEAMGFEDLQIRELEEESWHQDYSINEDEKQVIYDKKTGELKLDQEENTIGDMENKVDMSDDEESESEEEDDNEQDEYGSMELHDDEEENNHFESYQTCNVTNNEDDWEAEFP